MTFVEIVAEVCGRMNLNSPEAQARIGVAVNRHYKRITASIGVDPARFVTRTTAATIGTPTVTFTGIEKIDRVIDGTDASAIRPLTEVSLHTIRTSQPVSGQPSTYAVQSVTSDSVTIRLDVRPASAYTLHADGITTRDELVGDDEPSFPASFHDIITWFVLAEELLRKEKVDVAATFEAKAERLLSDLRFQMADSPTLLLRAAERPGMGGFSGSGGSSGGSGGGGGTGVGWFNVMDYGAARDGVTDDSGAFAATEAAAPEGATIFIPYGRYAINTTVTFTKAVTIRGEGGLTTTLAPFGDDDWNDQAEYGTVILTTLTSGAVFAFTTDYRYRNLHDFLIKGPGSGTSIGISGGVAGTTHWGNSVWSNVWCCNLRTGFAITGADANDNCFEQVHAIGCGTGYKYGGHVSDNCNQNTTVQWVADMCGTGVSLHHAVKNVWTGGLLANVQNSGWGIDFVFGEENTFSDVYCENPVYTGGAIRNAVNTGDYNRFLDFHITGMDVEIGSNGSTLRVGKYSTGDIAISGTQCRLEGNHTGTLSITGDYSAWHYIGADGDSYQFGDDKQGGLTVEGGSPLSMGLTTTDGTLFQLSARDDISSLYGRLRFKRAAGDNVEVINIDSNDHIAVGPSSGSIRLDLRSAYDITVSRGIRFPDSHQASSDVNTLDDYQEGTWTPTLVAATSQTGQVWTRREGVYQKIGNRYYISGVMELSTLGTFTGDIILSGLPEVSGGASTTVVGGITVTRFENQTGNFASLGARISGAGAGGMVFYGLKLATGQNSTLVQADLAATTIIEFFGHYLANT